MANFLGDSFVKADGSSVDLSYVSRGKIVVVLYTAGWFPLYSSSSFTSLSHMSVVLRLPCRLVTRVQALQGELEGILR